MNISDLRSVLSSPSVLPIICETTSKHSRISPSPPSRCARPRITLRQSLVSYREPEVNAADLTLRVGAPWMGMGLVLGSRTMKGLSSSEDCLHARVKNAWQTCLPTSRLHARRTGVRRFLNFLCELFPVSSLPLSFFLIHKTPLSLTWFRPPKTFSLTAKFMITLTSVTEAHRFVRKLHASYLFIYGEDVPITAKIIV